MYRKSISEWADKYGSATAFSFMLYSEIWDDEISTLASALTLSLFAEGMQMEFQLLVEEVDTKKALALKDHRGTSLQIVFPETVLSLESLVRKTTNVCMDALAIKYKFISSKEVVNHS